jgi:GH35 family endo-1,4-beta-xylanase
LTSFAQQVRDMGLELLITELDVDNVGVPPADVDKVTASKYSEFIDILGPYVKVITLEALEDYPAGSGAPDAIARANIFDVDYQPKQAFASLTDALNRLPSRSHV